MISFFLGVGSSAPVHLGGIRTISWNVPGALDGYASSCGFIGWRMRRTRIILTTVTHPLALSKPYAHHPHDSYASSCSFHYFDWLALVGVSRMDRWLTVEVPRSETPPGWVPGGCALSTPKLVVVRAWMTKKAWKTDPPSIFESFECVWVVKFCCRISSTFRTIF